MKGDRATLKPKADGSIDESKFAEGALAGRMIVPAGKTCELDVELTTGTYTLFCNMVEDHGRRTTRPLRQRHVGGGRGVLALSGSLRAGIPGPLTRATPPVHSGLAASVHGRVRLAAVAETTPRGRERSSPEGA